MVLKRPPHPQILCRTSAALLERSKTVQLIEELIVRKDRYVRYLLKSLNRQNENSIIIIAYRHSLVKSQRYLDLYPCYLFLSSQV